MQVRTYGMVQYAVFILSTSTLNRFHTKGGGGDARDSKMADMASAVAQLVAVTGCEPHEALSLLQQVQNGVHVQPDFNFCGSFPEHGVFVWLLFVLHEQAGGNIEAAANEYFITSEVRARTPIYPAKPCLSYRSFLSTPKHPFQTMLRVVRAAAPTAAANTQAKRRARI